MLLYQSPPLFSPSLYNKCHSFHSGKEAAKGAGRVLQSVTGPQQLVQPIAFRGIASVDVFFPLSVFFFLFSVVVSPRSLWPLFLKGPLQPEQFKLFCLVCGVCVCVRAGGRVRWGIWQLLWSVKHKQEGASKWVALCLGEECWVRPSHSPAWDREQTGWDYHRGQEKLWISHFAQLFQNLG